MSHILIKLIILTLDTLIVKLVIVGSGNKREKHGLPRKKKLLNELLTSRL